MSKVKYQLRYLVMPDYVYMDKRLNDISRRVYCFIHTYKPEKGFFFSNKALMKMFNCSSRSIDRAISQLVELKYIKVSLEQKAKGGKRRYIRDIRQDAINGVSKVSKVAFQDEAIKTPEVASRNVPLTEGGNGNKKGNILRGEKPYKEKTSTKTPTPVVNEKLGTLLDSREAKKTSKGTFPSYKPRQPFEKKPRTLADGRGVL